MDMLFRASWRPACRQAEIDPLDLLARPSGVCRLLLALAVIAAIVSLLGQAANATSDSPVVASTATPTHWEH